MCDIVESSIVVPASLVRECCGLAIDFGSSLCKIIYRSKENLEDAKTKTKETDLSHLQLVHIAVAQWEKVLEHVKKRSVLSSSEEPLIVKTTGQGCSAFGQLIENKLSIKLKQMTEFDCFIKAFNYLAHTLDRSTFLEAFEVDSIDEVIAASLAQMQAMTEIMSTADPCLFGQNKGEVDRLIASIQLDPRNFIKNLSGIKFDGKTSNQPLASAEPVYPALLSMCGSGFGFMQINEDKTFNVVEASSRGGRALLGLACLLVSCKSYEEFIELASTGCSSNLDFSVSDFYASMQDSTDEVNMYTVKVDMPQDILLFCFGKVLPGKKLEDYKRQDVARALLNYFILDNVQTTVLTCHAYNIGRVFLTGNFFNHPFVRLIFTKEMARKNITNFYFSTGKKKPVGFDFVKAGGYLGAVGALIS